MSSGRHMVGKVGVDMSLALEAGHRVKCALRQMQDVLHLKARLDAPLTAPIMTHTLIAVQCRLAVQYAGTAVQILTNSHRERVRSHFTSLFYNMSIKFLKFLSSFIWFGFLLSKLLFINIRKFLFERFLNQSLNRHCFPFLIIKLPPFGCGAWTQQIYLFSFSVPLIDINNILSQMPF